MYWLILSLSITAIASVTGSNDEIVMVTSRPIHVKANAQGKIFLDVEVKNGFHIQAHKVTDEFLVPTTLEIKQNDEFVIEEPVFPPSKRFRLRGTESYLEVYDGRFEIRSTVAAKRTVQKGMHRLNGTLRYQACDSVRCLFPRSVEFVVDITVK